MKINGKHHRSIELAENGWTVRVIDQRLLPWEVRFVELKTCDEAAQAIKDMWVRGAPLIGAVAAYGICLALREDASDVMLVRAYNQLLATRPTAINLKWALDRMRDTLAPLPAKEWVAAAYKRAADLCDEDVELFFGNNHFHVSGREHDS